MKESRNTIGLVRKLSAYAQISDEAQAAIEAMTLSLQLFHPNDHIVTEGSRAANVMVVERGWAIRFRTLEDGRRQIVNIMLPGDMFDQQVLVQSKTDHGVEALTDVEIRALDPTGFLNVFNEYPDLARALWWSVVQEEGLLREQIVQLGQRTAKERLAHVFIELFHRLRIIGMIDGDDDAYRMPLRNSHLSDYLGMSRVHVSRTLQFMKSEGLIRRRPQFIELLDRKGLRDLAQFDPKHLHLPSVPPPSQP